MRPKNDGVRNAVAAALLLATLLLGARLAEGAVDTTMWGPTPRGEQARRSAQREQPARMPAERRGASLIFSDS